MDVGRVVELYATGAGGEAGQVGSGYRLTEQLVLTAAHVVADIRIMTPGAPVPDDVDAPGMCRARPLGSTDWVPAAVVWRNTDADVAVLRLAASASPPPGSPAPRWGRVEGTEPIAVDAVGFPWAQEGIDRRRDTEHLHGFLTPGTAVRAGQLAITVLTSPPSARDGGSPWAGMSGAALFAGPFLVGVVIVDPARFGTDRVVAAPTAPLKADPALTALLGPPAVVTRVGPRLRLAITADTSVAVTPPYRAASARLGREPSRLLLPEHGIVPFLGRGTELQTLQAWCLNGGGAALRLLLGAGGAGKTRLAAEACVRLAGHGWQAGFADADAPGGNPVLAFDRPTLLAVDDADLYVDLLTGLVRALGYWPPDAPPVRLLLLTRHTTGWWHTLNQRTDHLAAELGDLPLTLHTGDLVSANRPAHHAAARAAFTHHLRPATRPAAPDSDQVPDLADDAFANPLLVHMHALLAAHGVAVPTGGSAVRERLLDAVLDRERRRWADTFPATVTTSSPTTHQRAVATATLFAPADQSASAALLAIIDDFADATAAARGAVADWLHQRYPGAQPPWIAPLRPDLLTEQLLASCPDLTGLVLTGHARLTDHHGSPAGTQVEQLLVELVRAAGRDPVRQALERLLAARLPDLLDAALAAPAGPLPDLLDTALTLCPQRSAAVALLDRLPEHSTGLAALAATLTAQAVDHHRIVTADNPETHTPRLAGALNNLSVRLTDLGRREDALTAVEEATGLYRALADARPDAFTPHLATALNNLSVQLADLGRREDALTAIEEATGLYRALADARPDAFTPHLATALNNLSNQLAHLGRREDALTAAHEAVTLRRALADARPDAFTPHLATALNNLSIQLAGLGRHEDALTAVQEATGLYRALADAHPDAFTPHLAGSLQSYGVVLTDLGHHEDALALDQEAVNLLRALCQRHPDLYREALAKALRNVAIDLRNLDRGQEAAQADDEAAKLADN
ncbi:tetratricopeptide repeat-containing serine protease family protein [Blastococcus montanus]|uniref:tetratricopeptide repeat-containing serine protease family protein n=1 Tax=Blastococcus montanus TaxID=3144973 RepID=UPI00320A662C